MNKDLIHIVFDLESTCWEDDGDFQRDNGEIIEIGAIKYRGKTKIDEFSQFIRPVKHPKLSDFCKKLTTITQDDVDNASLFNDVMRNFEQWIKEGNEELKIYFWSCGDYDPRQITKECIMNSYQGQMVQLLTNAKNMKHVFGDLTGIRGRRSMSRMLEYFQIPLEGTHHRGIDDARNLGKIFEKMYDYTQTWLR